MDSFNKSYKFPTKCTINDRLNAPINYKPLLNKPFAKFIDASLRALVKSMRTTSQKFFHKCQNPCIKGINAALE